MIKIAVLLLMVFFLTSCTSEDKVFPVEPYIEFRKLQFIKDKAGNYQDTLNLEIYLRDGDSDLGLRPFGYYSIETRYSPKNYYLKSNGEVFNFYEYPTSLEFKQKFIFMLPNLITYKDRKIQGLDTLPAFSPSELYDCNWEIIHDNPKIIDTVYFRINPNYYNIFIDLYVKHDNGSWNLLNPEQYSFCSSGLNGRFPMISKPLPKPGPFSYKMKAFDIIEGPFAIKMQSEKEGIMSYNMVGALFKVYFLGKKIKLRARIQDRALNKSNWIETPEVQL